MPTLSQADEVLGKYLDDTTASLDANDLLYQISASWDYDPGPGLEKTRAPLIAVNSDDDLINPPELRILEREIQRVPRGEAILIPLSEQTRGHGTHTLAALWKPQLVKLLALAAER
jgi:homoserine O-acetyltransferase